MKSPARIVVWLLPLCLTACFDFHRHKQEPVQAFVPPLSSSDSPKPSITPIELPPSTLLIPTQPLTSLASVMPAQKLKRPQKHLKATVANTPPPATPPQQAVNEIPAVSAVGQLTSGAPSDLRRETTDSIAATEHGLSGIGRSLSDQDQKTATQIREYLKQAKDALTTGDVDGAHTLAAKAKVLLSELTQ